MIILNDKVKKWFKMKKNYSNSNSNSIEKPFKFSKISNNLKNALSLKRLGFYI
jgi:hypothetical protein